MKNFVLFMHPTYGAAVRATALVIVLDRVHMQLRFGGARNMSQRCALPLVLA